MSVEKFERMFVDEFDVYCDIIDKDGLLADKLRSHFREDLQLSPLFIKD